MIGTKLRFWTNSQRHTRYNRYNLTPRKFESSERSIGSPLLLNLHQVERDLGV